MDLPKSPILKMSRLRITDLLITRLMFAILSSSAPSPHLSKSIVLILDPVDIQKTETEISILDRGKSSETRI